MPEARPFTVLVNQQVEHALDIELQFEMSDHTTLTCDPAHYRVDTHAGWRDLEVIVRKNAEHHRRAVIVHMKADRTPTNVDVSEAVGYGIDKFVAGEFESFHLPQHDPARELQARGDGFPSVTDRAKALEALQRIMVWAHRGADEGGFEGPDYSSETAHLDAAKQEDLLRSAIDRAYPPEEDEDGDPVGEVVKPERWIIEVQSERGEWARVPLGVGSAFPSEYAAREWAQHMKSARVRKVDG